MTPRILLALLLGYAGLCAAGQGVVVSDKQDHANPHAKRAVTVADAIEMTQIGDRAYLDDFAKGGNVAQFSPDGSKFVFVTQKGNLKNDTVEFSLLVFRTVDAFTSPRPEVVATLASSSNREAISHVKWLQDNDTLVFLGERPEEVPQLYKVSYTAKKLEKLTNHPTPVIAYSMSDRGDSFVYVAEVPPQPVVSNKMRRQGFAVTSEKWTDLYTNRGPSFDVRKEIFVKTPSMDAPRNIGGVLNLYPDPEVMQLNISPDGRYALISAYISAPPAAWDEYHPGFETVSAAQACATGETLRCPQQYLLMDLQKKTIEPLIDAPIMQTPVGAIELVAWTRQNSVLLVNAFLPLDSLNPEKRSLRLHNVYAAEVLLPAKGIVEIERRQAPFPALYLQPYPEKDRFVTQPNAPVSGPPLEFHKNSSGWQITELATAEPADHLYVTLSQGINSPPTLVVNDPKTKRKAQLLDLNPQFAQLAFGRVELFRWKTRDGRPAEGSLYYPPDYVTGKRYPLVIQTHGNSRERFWIDGPFSTAFAAQPLANRGFLVLQMGIGDWYDKASLDEWTKIMSTSQEGPYTVAFLESAVDELDRQGLIDRNRVGLTGFSRTVYHVLFALTHSSYHFAAAVAADGVNFGYVDCVLYLTRGDSSICDTMNGGPPFGANLSVWATQAPTFMLDRIEAPLLLQAISGPLGEFEILAGLRWLGKPVEMLNFYPEGEHVLVKPGQRLISQQVTVDWYCFWLKGEEDGDPAKVGQYARWRMMRQQRDRNPARAVN